MDTFRWLWPKLRKHLVGVGIVAAEIALLDRVFRVNETTAALALLVAVLWTSTTQGLFPALTVSVAAMLGLNFFFIPPIGTLTVADPQNWVALSVFLLTAVTASNLAARAERRAREAQQGSRETQRLFELGRGILVNEDPEHTVSSALTDMVRVFELRSAVFYGVGDFRGDSIMEPNAPPSELFERAIERSSIVYDRDWMIVAVRLGAARNSGALGLAGHPLTTVAGEAAANLLAIALERRSALHRAAEGEAARMSDSLRAALLDGLAHEIKTPLTAVRAAITSLLTKREQFSGSPAEYLDIIHEESERLNDVVSNAIESARLESGPLKLRLTRQDLGELIEELAGQRSAARFRIHRDECLPELLFDRSLIKLALKQVLDNALRYSPEHTPVDVSIGIVGEKAIVSVLDRGPGVPASERERIFEKFFRGKTGQKVAGGTGLGLAVAKRIIEAHKGTIEAGDRAGGGAEFRVELPLDQDGVGNNSRRG